MTVRQHNKVWIKNDLQLPAELDLIQNAAHNKSCSAQNYGSHFLLFSCTRPLKLWPKGIGPKVFKCQIGQECDPELLKDPQSGLNLEKQLHTRSKLIDNLNTGESRYSCYEDGFDVCNRCADEVGLKLTFCFHQSAVCLLLGHVCQADPHTLNIKQYKVICGLLIKKGIEWRMV